jgi:hypothetical protein
MNATALFQTIAILATSTFVVPMTSKTVPSTLPVDAETAEVYFVADQVAVSSGPLESLVYRAPGASQAVNPASTSADELSSAVTASPSGFSRGGTF